MDLKSQSLNWKQSSSPGIYFWHYEAKIHCLLLQHIKKISDKWRVLFIAASLCCLTFPPKGCCQPPSLEPLSGHRGTVRVCRRQTQQRENLSQASSQACLAGLHCTDPGKLSEVLGEGPHVLKVKPRICNRGPAASYTVKPCIQTCA